MSGELDPAAAIRIVSPFVPEWSAIDPNELTVTQIEGGVINTVHLIIHRGRGIIVKQYGGNKFSKEDCANETAKQSEVLEVLSAHVMSSKGWGPKLLGVYPGGRIEEYIDSHNLRPDECIDPTIRRDIARSFARLHSLKLPLRQQSLASVIRDMMAYFSCSKTKDTIREYVQSVDHPDAAIVAQQVTDFDHAEELGYVLQQLQSRCRESLIILDCNFNNILVKHQTDPTDMTVVLIDYEGVMYGFRGVDIGSHFCNRLVQWLDKGSKLTGLLYPEAEDREAFCEEYRNEMIQLEKELHPELDTVEHLMVEGEIGSLFYFCFESCWLLKYCKNFLQDRPFMSAIRFMHENYTKAKQRYTQALHR